MGLPAGTLDPSGQFSEHSVYGKVKQNLDVLHEASKHLR
jgi:hypothetical protein